jgi:hypothetical protein
MFVRARLLLLRLRAAARAAACKPESSVQEEYQFLLALASLASIGLTDLRAMGTECHDRRETMKVKTQMRAGLIALPPPGGRCGV